MRGNPSLRQTGESIGQAKVFEAHAVPQGFPGNLINALKLLANQQEDGDGLVQNIVTNLGKGSRKGLTEGLREFIKIDNERALVVGYLNLGIDASSRGSGYVEDIHQCRPHRKGEVVSSLRRIRLGRLLSGVV